MEKSIDIGLKLSNVEFKPGKTGLLHVSISPPEDNVRKPCALICIVDVSGSMGTECTIQNTGEAVGYSTIDLVKHSVKTVVHMLGSEDYIALVPFTTQATVLMDFTKMSEAGKKEALEKIESMTSLNSTNLLDGLKVSMDLARSSPVCKEYATSLWLFTDGQPDQSRADILKFLNTYLGGKAPEFTMHAFGFGYNLDSELLFEISNIGHGIYCYLPDCNLVGTTFVNCLCNILTTAVDRVSLDIEIGGKLSKFQCLGYDMEKNHIDVGTVLYGQSRDFIIEYAIPSGKIPSFKVKLAFKGGKKEQTIEGFKADNPIATYIELCRSGFGEYINKGLKSYMSGNTDTSFLKNVIEYYKTTPCKDDDHVKTLLRDLESPDEMEGRVSKAFSTTERMQRWGAHYVRSIIRAHQLQQCHNFKDPGVQIYGGKLFKELQKKADLVFCSLPPPTSSVKPSDPSSPQRQSPSMQTFNNCSGGCFDGEGLVKLSSGILKKVKELQKDDEVIDSNGVIAKVVCLVVFPINKTISMVKINGLYISPKHPLRSKGVWKLPQDINPIEDVYIDCIYNVVLDKNHIINVNGTELVTLGHGRSEDILQHPYYGTSRIISDLKQLAQWTEGKVVVAANHKLRDPLTAKVIAFH